MDLLIWLDIDKATCIKRLSERVSEGAKSLSRDQLECELKTLIDWALAYHQRDDLRSYTGHQSIFDEFDGEKILLKSEDEVAQFLKKWATGGGGITRSCFGEIDD